MEHEKPLAEALGVSKLAYEMVPVPKRKQVSGLLLKEQLPPLLPEEVQQLELEVWVHGVGQGQGEVSQKGLGWHQELVSRQEE